jgi:hypothetical protein
MVKQRNPKKSLKVLLCGTFKLFSGFDFSAKRYMNLLIGE